MDEDYVTRLECYSRMLEICVEYGWPEMYKSDVLRVDREWIFNKKISIPFGWVLRATGTHLIVRDQNPLEYFRPVYNLYREGGTAGSTARWFAVFPASIKEVSPEEMREFILAHLI